MVIQDVENPGITYLMEGRFKMKLIKMLALLGIWTFESI